MTSEQTERVVIFCPQRSAQGSESASLEDRVPCELTGHLSAAPVHGSQWSRWTCWSDQRPGAFWVDPELEKLGLQGHPGACGGVGAGTGGSRSPGQWDRVALARAGRDITNTLSSHSGFTGIDTGPLLVVDGLLR